jgi:hypothetical protein
MSDMKGVTRDARPDKHLRVSTRAPLPDRKTNDGSYVCVSM